MFISNHQVADMLILLITDFGVYKHRAAELLIAHLIGSRIGHDAAIPRHKRVQDEPAPQTWSGLSASSLCDPLRANSRSRVNGDWLYLRAARRQLRRDAPDPAQYSCPVGLRISSRDAVRNHGLYSIEMVSAGGRAQRLGVDSQRPRRELPRSRTPGSLARR